MEIAHHDYFVIYVSAKGRGGTPDEEINRRMQAMYLMRAIPDKTLAEMAKPTPAMEKKLLLRVFQKKPGSSQTCAFIKTETGTKDCFMDRGLVLQEEPKSDDSNHKIITMEGQGIFRLTFECEPVNAPPPTVGATRLRSDPPLDDNVSLEAILQEKPAPKLQAVESQTLNEPARADLQASTVQSSAITKTTNSKKERKPNTVKKQANPMEERKVSLVIEKVLKYCDIKYDQLIDTSLRGQYSKARQMCAGISMNRLKVSASIIKKTLLPQATNAGQLYGLAKTAETFEGADKGAMNRIAKEVKDELGTDQTNNPSSSKAQSAAETVGTPVVGTSFDDALNYVLYGLGIPADKIAESRGIPVDQVFNSVGRTNFALNSKAASTIDSIRKLAPLVHS